MMDSMPTYSSSRWNVPVTAAAPAREVRSCRGAVLRRALRHCLVSELVPQQLEDEPQPARYDLEHGLVIASFHV